MQFGQILPKEHDPALSLLDLSGEQFEDRALSRAGSANEKNEFTALNSQAEVPQTGLMAGIFHSDVFKFYFRGIGDHAFRKDAGERQVKTREARLPSESITSRA